MEREEHIHNLFNKYLDNEINEEELKELLYHFNVVDDKVVLVELIGAELAKEPTDVHNQEVIRNIAHNIERKLFADLKPSRQIRDIAALWTAAAMLLMAMTVTAYLYFSKNKSSDIQTSRLINDALPGSSKATLTLINGKTINLTSVQNGTLANEAGSIVTKNSKEQIVYEYAKNKNDVPGYNVLQTPKGGEYQVVLPDGTKVWLNAASSLKYPTSFTSFKERSVELTGEAYFEVAHNKSQAFRVKSAGQTVEVLGTHFNIMAYHDEKAITTTLLEGSIKVSKENISKIIKPGEESLVRNDIIVREADLDAAVAWKNGRTYFKDADIKTIMRSVSRWYDIQVVYQGVITKELFTGGISRKSNLSALLKILEAGGIHASIENGKLIVKP